MLPEIFVEMLPIVSTLCQIGTACIAVSIACVTYRYTRRQTALSLISHNNAMANAVNSTVITSPEARAVFGRLQEVIIGTPDDAVVFMYLNYVHNTFRMRRIGAVSESVWQDTLGACASFCRKLTREQLGRFLSRGYEPAFCAAVLASHEPKVAAGNDNGPLVQLVA